MKFLSLFLVFSLSASAATPCKGKAVQAAMAKYISNGPIQGDAPVPSHRLLKKTSSELSHNVSVEGGNDEGETWTVFYKVVTGIAPACKVKSVKQTKVL